LAREGGGGQGAAGRRSGPGKPGSWRAAVALELPAVKARPGSPLAVRFVAKRVGQRQR
jgi:hypothetical protein